MEAGALPGEVARVEGGDMSISKDSLMRMMGRVFFIALAISGVKQVYGQLPTATLLGTVTDEQAAVVVGASVTATNTIRTPSCTIQRPSRPAKRTSGSIRICLLPSHLGNWAT